MKTVFASALIATAALTGAAHAAIPQAQALEIQKYAPNVDISAVTDRDAALAVAFIRSGETENQKRQDVRSLLR